MSLLQPPFLWALAALLVPLWIHLSRRRQYRELPLGSLRFLKEVLKERRKRARFEEIPLMILRLLAVGLIAVLFGRPFLNSSRNAPESPAETVVLLDASGSVTEAMKRAGMGYAKQVAGSVPEGQQVDAGAVLG